MPNVKWILEIGYWKLDIGNFRRRAEGFTLIEIVVVIAILSVVFAAVIRTVNPAVQLEKARDAQRLHDISQIKTALDSYYNDTRCYPTTLTFGSQFKVGETVYMQKVPADPKVPSGYTYQTKTGDTCPQWNVLYAKLENPKTQSKDICPLSKLTSNCVPTNFDASWACQVLGDVDCNYVATTTVGLAPIPPGGSPTPTPTPGAGGLGGTPGPTTDPRTQTYYISSTLIPTMTQADITPLDPAVGQTQTMTIYMTDTSPVTSVSVRVRRDNVYKTYPMTLTSGTATQGAWMASFLTQTTYTSNYMASFTATNSAGQVALTEVAIK